MIFVLLSLCMCYFCCADFSLSTSCVWQTPVFLDTAQYSLLYVAFYEDSSIEWTLPSFVFPNQHAVCLHYSTSFTRIHVCLYFSSSTLSSLSSSCLSMRFLKEGNIAYWPLNYHPLAQNLAYQTHWNTCLVPELGWLKKLGAGQISLSLHVARLGFSHMVPGNMTAGVPHNKCFRWALQGISWLDFIGYTGPA